MTSCGPNNGAGLLDEMKLLGEAKSKTSGRKMINSELWHACAGPLVSLPQSGSLVYYFPQGHSEQVTASTRKLANSQIPNYPNLPSQLLCQVHNVTLHADKDTDEIYAQMTLQPVNSENDVFPIPDLGHTKSKHPTEFFCKNLTASDTSTHGGFSVPRRAAEKLFPQLDYSMQPPNQELVVKDLHDNLWTFRHIYRGQPKRHLLTTGWSLFVGTKRLRAGDSVLFIRDEKSQLLLGIRRANRQQSALPSSVLSTDSMHIGVLAAAAHAAASKSPFTVYYNPRACPSDFIIPLIKYNRAVYTQVSIGMRFGMMFETEESCKRRYMGTIIGISDCDATRWPNSKWRNLQVEWDEHGYGERPERVSLWEIETPESLFVSPEATLSLKRQCLPGFVVPAVNIGFQNAEPLSADVRPDQMLKLLSSPQIVNLDTLPTCDQSIYASILQNVRNSNISRNCSSNISAFCAMIGSTQQEVATKVMMQQKHQFPPSQQLLLPSSQVSTIPQGFHLDYALLSSTKSQDIGKDESHPGRAEQNCPNNDTADEHRMNMQSEIALSDEIAPEKSEIDSVMSTNDMDKQSVDIIDRSCKLLAENKILEEPGLENSGGPFGNEDLSAKIFAKPKMEAKGQNDNQILDHQLETIALQSPGLDAVQASDRINPNNLMGCQGYSPSYLDHDDWFQQSPFQSFTGSPKTPEILSVSDRQELMSAVENTVSSSADLSCVVNPQTLDPVRTCQRSCISDSRSSQYYSACVQELLATSELNPLQNVQVAQGFLFSQGNNLEIPGKETMLQNISNSCIRRDLSTEINHYSESLNNPQCSSKNGNVVVCPVADVAMKCYNTAQSSNFLLPSEVPACNPASNDDFMPQIMTASLLEHKLFSLQHIPDSTGGASSGSIDTKECSLYRGSSKQSSQQPIRTYTKVQKLGSVGRSIDVTRFTNYNELKSAIACMFGLKGQLDEPESSEWKLVYVDYENDVLLVGDDPWEEFVSCVRCIKILSPSEVQQMSQEGMQL